MKKFQNFTWPILNLKIRTPIKALIGFYRTFLNLGESRVIHFILTIDGMTLTLKSGSKKLLQGKTSLGIRSCQADRQSELQNSTIA